MQVYDLDENDDFDIIRIGDTEYKIGDIPVWIYEKIQKINITSDDKLIEAWRKIIIELLEIKNEEIEYDNILNKHILKMIEIISNKIKNQDDYKI